MNITVYFQQIFKNRPFCLFLLSSFFLFLISQFYFLAQVSMILDITKSTILLGTVLMVMAVPRLIILPLGGILTDKFSEKKVLIFGYTSLICLLGVLSLLVTFNLLSVTVILVFAALFGISSALILPATYSIVPKLVDETVLQSANALVQFQNQLSFFIGPAIAGLLLETVELGIFFLLMLLLIILSLILILYIKPQTDENNKMEDKSARSKGFGDVIKDPTVVMLILFTAMLNISVIGPQQVGLPVLAESHLKMDTKGLGYLLSTFGLGSLMGVVIGGILSNRKNNLVTLFLLAIQFGVIWAGFTFITDIRITFVLLCLTGILIGVINVLFITALQTSSPKYLLGRVMSLQFMGSTGLQPLSYFFTGLLISLTSLQITFLIAGLIIFVFSIVLLASINYLKINKNSEKVFDGIRERG
ncbi:MFS transporter [Bacillus stratosphericus]|uniref:MFS transporter n=1 Tax=Bacillus stratosphericus TaxID=293386 RepID=UPI001CF97817|nr:MFS transporter [Bacillus stratosphericus]